MVCSHEKVSIAGHPFEKETSENQIKQCFWLLFLSNNDLLAFSLSEE